MEKPKIPVDLIMKNLAEEAEHAHERVQKASDILLGSLETDIATTPYDVVYEEDRVKLKHYHTPNTEKSEIKTPLLVVYALINRETMLDLQPERSVVKNFLDHGVNLYMVDWGYPTTKDKFLTIDDHVNGYMDNIIEFICKSEGVEKINLMGICMGGTFSVIYSALHPDKIKNLITTVCPTNFDTTQGLLHIWMKWMNVDKVLETFGNMPGDLMNFGFLLLNPARLMIDKYIGFFENMDNKPFVENFVRMEKWIFDSPDIPGETLRQFIKDFYQDNLLIQSKLMVGGKQVDLQKITMPLLNIYAQYDHLVPPGAADKITSAVGSTDTEDVCLDTGHIGIYVSSKTQKEFAPKIIQWLKDHDLRFEPEHQVSPGKKKTARSRANSTMKKKPLSIKRIEEMSHAGKAKLFFDDMQSEQGLRDNP